MFRFAGSRVAPAALFDASLLDFLKDRHAAVLFFGPSGIARRGHDFAPRGPHFRMMKMPAVNHE
ncbi:MAG: hypothetical protein CTY25_11790 [Methylobacterium sp.]|nr:MAG: hypothetical protein CTY25_11790 [Methylobacterium sp.]